MMSFPVSEATTPARTAHAAPPGRSKHLYFALSADAAAAAPAAQEYLHAQVAAVRDIPADLPASLADLPGWMQERTDAVGEQYRDYLAGRKKGAPRRYFDSRAHALYFLQAVAPTKLVDGAWLYGLLAHWQNPDFHPLIKTYLEELGDGLPDKNHVTLYRKLLATNGCEHWDELDDRHFVQGAIQLALGHNADRFLPELIGYNLGYEQLPLHLLITSYELNELGFDPYYFTLHVTVDNAASGHARKAVQALAQLMPRTGGQADFHRRVLDGYRLNELGASTTSVIAEFDLEAELVRILAAKSAVGKNMHSDYCRVAGRSANDWLAEPARVPDFLAALEGAGWIKRGEDVEHSRFWRLIHGERAEMFGVFSSYEQQVLRDWIHCAPEASAAARRMPSHRARQRSLDQLGAAPAAGQAHPERGLIRRHPSEPDGDGANELRQLEERVAACASKADAMALLAALMSPSAHHTALGLMATRMYSRLLDT
ncbi:MAG: iron-containing redox enzyme family protein [Massilia sp.]